MLELQASSRLPPPTTAAPTPAARNRPRRETPPTVRLARTGLISLVGHDLNISFRRDAEIVAEGYGKSLSEC